MKYLVTGANGFIGSYLCKYLVQQGNLVTGIARKFSPSIQNKLRGITCIENDIMNPDICSLQVDADCVIHLASANDVVSRNLAEGINLSVLGTANILQLLHNNNIQKLIFFSTLQVYGVTLNGNFDELSKVDPENNYALNHLYAEKYIQMHNRNGQINAAIIRPSNIYGEMIDKEINRWSLVPGCFVKEALDHGTITLLSSGKQTRNFINLEQVASSTDKIAQQLNLPNEIINLVSNDYFNIVQIAEWTKQILFEDFKIDVALHSKNKEPEHSNSFSFSHQKIDKYHINFEQQDNLRIKSAIRYLINLYRNAI